MTNCADPDQLASSEPSWLPQKPTDLDLHCLQRQGIFRFSRTRVKKGTGVQHREEKSQELSKNGKKKSVYLVPIQDLVFLKSRHFIIKERFNKLIYSFNTIIK